MWDEKSLGKYSNARVKVNPNPNATPMSKATPHVHFHHKLPSGIWVRKNRCSGELYLEAGKGGLGLFVPKEELECGGESSQWCRHIAVIPNKVPVKVVEAGAVI